MDLIAASTDFADAAGLKWIVCFNKIKFSASVLHLVSFCILTWFLFSNKMSWWHLPKRSFGRILFTHCQSSIAWNICKGILSPSIFCSWSQSWVVFFIHSYTEEMSISAVKHLCQTSCWQQAESNLVFWLDQAPVGDGSRRSVCGHLRFYSNTRESPLPCFLHLAVNLVM